MSGYQEKIKRRTRRQKTQFEETKQVSETDIAGMLKLSDQELKKTINILRAPKIK